MSTSTQGQGGDGNHDHEKPYKSKPKKRKGATPESDKRYHEKKKQQFLDLQEGLRRANEQIETLQAELQAERNRAAEERNRAAALEARIRQLEAEQLRNVQSEIPFGTLNFAGVETDADAAFDGIAEDVDNGSDALANVHVPPPPIQCEDDGQANVNATNLIQFVYDDDGNGGDPLSSQFQNEEDIPDPNLQERCALIQGTPEEISHATAKNSELVTRSTGRNQPQETFYMHVPANKTGLVIGKGGDTIKQICNETNAHVELSRDSPPNSNEKVFVIRGTPYQIHHVQHIIRIKMGDLAQGTPLPPFHGTVGATALATAAAPQLTAVGNPYGPTNPQPFSMAPTSQVQDPSVWNQYYSQPQQIGFASATAAAAHPQFGTAAAAHITRPSPGQWQPPFR